MNFVTGKMQDNSISRGPLGIKQKNNNLDRGDDLLVDIKRGFAEA